MDFKKDTNTRNVVWSKKLNVKKFASIGENSVAEVYLLYARLKKQKATCVALCYWHMHLRIVDNGWTSESETSLKSEGNFQSSAVIFYFKNALCVFFWLVILHDFGGEKCAQEYYFMKTT